MLHMIENSSMKDAACLKSLQGKGSGVWLDCIPSSQKLALSLIVLFGSFDRLGLPMPLLPSVDTCECGKPLDDEVYLLITCKTCGGVDQFGPIIPSV